jgi:hypothetical protein
MKKLLIGFTLMTTTLSYSKAEIQANTSLLNRLSQVGSINLNTQVNSNSVNCPNTLTFESVEVLTTTQGFSSNGFEVNGDGNYLASGSLDFLNKGVIKKRYYDSEYHMFNKFTEKISTTSSEVLIMHSYVYSAVPLFLSFGPLKQNIMNKHKTIFKIQKIEDGLHVSFSEKSLMNSESMSCLYNL